jgi:RNA polymerase sigma-70 factor (ECF subfamily)
MILYANRFTKNTEVSSNIVQDVFVEILEKDKLTEISNIRSYLFQSVKNRSLNFLKKESIMAVEPNDYNLSIYSRFNDPIEASEFEAHIFKLIESMSPATKNIFTLSRFENLKNDEIAKKLNISKRTVELQISNALKFLREKLKQQGDTRYRKYYFLLLY